MDEHNVGATTSLVNVHLRHLKAAQIRFAFSYFSRNKETFKETSAGRILKNENTKMENRKKIQLQRFKALCSNQTLTPKIKVFSQPLEPYVPF